MMLMEIFSEFAKGKGIADDAFLVGGTVRDLLLGREMKDVDIAVNGDAIDIGRSFAAVAGGSFVLLDRDFGIVRIVKNHEYIDVCAMRGDAITNDLAERDLTINAMAIPVSQIKSMGMSRSALADIVVDPFDGQRDLKYSIIRMVSEENLIKDPLRLLRAYRFSATLNFTVEVHTSTAVKTHAALISNAAVERIAEELRQLLMVDDSYSAIKEMGKDGLLYHVFPELTEFSSESFHYVRQSYGYMEHILRNLPLYFPGRSEPIWDYFAEGYRTFCLKLAVLLQDGESAEKVTLRLKLSSKEVAFVHMISSSRKVLIVLNSDNKSVIIRLLREFGDNLYPLLIYNLACGRVCQLSGNPLMSLARDVISIYQNEFIPRQKKLPFISGNDLIQELNLSPSPLFKNILSAVELLALEGRINSREEALKVAEKIISEKLSPSDQ